MTKKMIKLFDRLLALEQAYGRFMDHAYSTPANKEKLDKAMNKINAARACISEQIADEILKEEAYSSRRIS